LHTSVLDSLPERRRTSFGLVREDNVTYKVAGDVFGLTPLAICAAAHRDARSRTQAPRTCSGAPFTIMSVFSSRRATIAGLEMGRHGCQFERAPAVGAVRCM